MLSVYLGSLLFGGVLLGASILGGHGDGADGGHALTAGHGHDGHLGEGGGHNAEHHQPSKLPFLSLRFWAFAAAFFGLTGTALTIAGGLGALTPLAAGVVGLGCGLVSARVLGDLSRQTVGLLGDASAHLGREGRVLLPLARGQRGKIRLQIGGTSTDLVAETEAEAPLAAGETAFIVGMRGNVALVERTPSALPAPGSPLLTEGQK